MSVPAYSEVARTAAQIFYGGRLWIIRFTPLCSTLLYSPFPLIVWALVNAKRGLAPKLCAAKNSRIRFKRGGRNYSE
jgi:hypothetical protein